MPFHRILLIATLAIVLAGRRTCAADELGPFLDDLAGESRELTIRTKQDLTGKYGRYLAELIAGEVNLNHALVAAGHAVPAEC